MIPAQRRQPFCGQFFSLLVFPLLLLVSALLGADMDPRSVEAFRQSLAKAEQGGARSQHAVAWCYIHGLGVAVDKAAGVRWMRSAAENGDAKAQWDLSTLSRHGLGDVLAPSAVEWERWLRASAAQGHPPAQSELGLALWKGTGLARDTATAMRLMRLAALSGDVEAASWVGSRHELGEELALDKAEAHAWYLWSSRCLDERRKRDPHGGSSSESHGRKRMLSLASRLTDSELQRSAMRFREIEEEARRLARR